jgi:predicted regulator of Ras-like GTPase activity (Roadblock/LC7/MglB family)
MSLNLLYSEFGGLKLDEATKNELRTILLEVFQKNSQVLMISLTTPEGLPILTLNRESTRSEILEISDTSITNRFAALAGASTSLGDRTLSTLSQEHVRLIHVQGKDRDVAIAVSPHLISLVVTEPSGSPNLIAEKLNTGLKAKI